MQYGSTDYWMETADIIRQYKEEILAQWMARVKQQLPEAENRDTVALRNDLPDLLNDIADNVELGHDHDTHESFDHGRIRASFDSYSLAHVIREYRILMETVLEIIDDKGDTSPADRDKIIFEITQAIEEASEVFFQSRQDKSERGKEEAEQLVAQLQEEGQLRDDFIGTVTHDLRNPLANTISLVELLKSRVEDNVTNYKLLDAIQTSANRADALIRNLLDVNLIKSGASLPLSIRECDIMNIVNTSVTAFRENHGSTIRIEADASTLPGFYDPEMIRRALDNLISNAIKYGTENGEVVVRCQRPEDDRVSISIHNQGNAIPEDQQAKIFSRHYRVSHHSSQQGWGIGLSLVQGIAQAHSGSVSLTSSEADGTTFIIAFPTQQPA